MLRKGREHHFAERPFECGECRKAIAVRYTEVLDGKMTHTSMCADCPDLQRRLYGTNPRDLITSQTGVPADLACGICSTTLEQVRRGSRLGCPECYTIFEGVILSELQSTHSLPTHILERKGLPLHLGRAPGARFEIKQSTRLLALNEALKDTLLREDYEQAAWLRDQIRDLMKEERLPEPPST